MGFSEEIMNWYARNKRDLPWRQTREPYKIWLSEIILQQTRIEQGRPYYMKFIKAYPTVFHLAAAPEEDVFKLWQGLGYYTRAKNLHATAKHVATTLDGIFPTSYTALLNLKGVGDYTASAIASICFNEPAPVLDGNVYRVLSRYFNVDIPINSSEGTRYFKTLAKELIYKKEPSTYNQAIMEFGAMQCKPKSPGCSKCPLNSSCGALQHAMVAKRPVKLKKTAIKKRFFNYLVIHDMKNVQLQKRTGKDIWQNLYEFPLVETAEATEENHIIHHKRFKTYVQGDTFKTVLYNRKDIIHKLSHQHIYTKFWIVTPGYTINDGVAISEIRKYPVPVLIANFIEKYNF